MLRKELVLLAAVSFGFSEQPYPPTEALRLVETALNQNPALASLRLESHAVHTLGLRHRTLESPELAVDFFQGPVSAFPNPLKRQEEIDYSVAQRIPFPGKLGSMAAAEHWRGAAAGKQAQSAGLDLRRDVLTAYADLYLAEWRLRLMKESRIEMGRLIETLRGGYSAGRGRQSDWLRAESEAAHLDAEILEAGAMRREARAALAAGLGLEDGGSSNLQLKMDSLNPPAFRPLQDSVKTVLDRSPGLEAMQFEISMADAEIKAAQKEALPDFMVRGTYKDMQNGSRDFWSLMVGIQAPITPWSWKGIGLGTSRARILREQSTRNYVSARQRLASELEKAVGDLESASGRVKLSQEKRIPIAAQMVQSVQSEYRQGSADFNELILSLREARMAREEYHRAVSDHLKAWANLDWVTGGNLSAMTKEEK